MIGAMTHRFYITLVLPIIYLPCIPLVPRFTGPTTYSPRPHWPYRLDPMWHMVNWTYEIMALRPNSLAIHWAYKSKSICCAGPMVRLCVRPMAQRADEPLVMWAIIPIFHWPIELKPRWETLYAILCTSFACADYEIMQLFLYLSNMFL